MDLLQLCLGVIALIVANVISTIVLNEEERGLFGANIIADPFGENRFTAAISCDVQIRLDQSKRQG